MTEATRGDEFAEAFCRPLAASHRQQRRRDRAQDASVAQFRPGMVRVRPAPDRLAARP